MVHSTLRNVLLAVLLLITATSTIADILKTGQSLQEFMEHALLSDNFQKYQEKHVIKRKFEKIYHNTQFKQGKRASGKEAHRVVFVIKHSHLDQAKRILNDISDPFSNNFGKHLTREEVNDLTVKVELIEHVTSYLKFEGVTVLPSTTELNMYITAEAPIAAWERIFSTQFHEYSHLKHSQLTLIRAQHYSLPENIFDYVSTVFNTVQFPDLKVPSKGTMHRRNQTSVPVKPNVAPRYQGYITPAVLKSFYNVTNINGRGYGSQAVYVSVDQTMSPSDLTYFQQYFELTVSGISQNINGHVDNNACPGGDITNCGEANLDIQYLMAIGQNIPTTYYYDDAEDIWLGFVQEVSAMTNPPKVITISYASYESAFDSDYLTAFNIEALKLSLMGVTLLSASGDDGVIGWRDERPSGCGYDPQFPASSPYVTAVGATMGPEYTGRTEIACTSTAGSSITSGGGFSGVFPTPDWQSAAVNAYFSSVSGTSRAPHKGYSATGRGYPDVSLAGNSYIVVADQELVVLSGTSASTPVFAGFVSLVNAKRLAAGKSTLGWINPSLYALASKIRLNDITSGENNCIHYDIMCCDQGFSSAAGWDPVTGLGSVNYGKFETTFFALGNNVNKPTFAPTLRAGTPTSRKPTATPSRKPTASPTSAAGWYYNTEYVTTGCTGTIMKMDGVATGQCMAFKTGYYAGYYGKISCNNDDVFFKLYSNSACTNLLYSWTQQTDFCATSFNPRGVYGNIQHSYKFQCTATATLPVPNNDNYFIKKFYKDNICSASAFDAFAAFRQNTCISEEDYNGNVYSSYYSYPQIRDYIGDDCTLASQMTYERSAQLHCFQPSSDDSYYYAYMDDMPRHSTSSVVESWQNNGGGGVSSPTPTSRPTARQVFEFDVTQNLIGISAATYNAEFSRNSMIFNQTIRTILPLIIVIPITCTVNRVVDSNTASSINHQLHTVSVVPTVNAEYTLRYDITNTVYSNRPADAYDAIKTQLITGVTRGTFTIYLGFLAQMEGQNSLVGVTSTTVTPSNTYHAVGTTATDTSNKKKSGSTRTVVIALSTISVLVVFLVASYCGYYYWRNYKAKHKTTKWQTRDAEHDLPSQARKQKARKSKSYAMVTNNEELNKDDII